MLNLVSKLSAGFLIAAVSGTTMAQAPISSPEPARVPTKAETDYNNEIVCEQTEVIGSRLAKKKVCMTRAQWADAQLQDRQHIEKVQVQRVMKGE